MRETPEDALIRECREELGVEIRPDSVYCELVHEYPDLTIRLTLYNARIVSGIPARLEHNDLRWIPVREIDEYSFCPADQQILELLKSGKGSAEER